LILLWDLFLNSDWNLLFISQSKSLYEILEVEAVILLKLLESLEKELLIRSLQPHSVLANSHEFNFVKSEILLILAHVLHLFPKLF